MGIASIGGARHTEPCTWELGNSLTLMEFLVSDSDVAVNSCSGFSPDKMRGSSLFPLITRKHSHKCPVKFFA